MAALRSAIEATGTRIAFVHMSPPEEADVWFAKHGVADITRVSDPSHRLYREFGLQEGSLAQLGHPRVWGRWIKTALGRGAGWQGSHWRQLTGVFLVRRGVVLAEIRHRNSAARPDYLAFVRQANAGATMTNEELRTKN